jgi:hypothetical protein
MPTESPDPFAVLDPFNDARLANLVRGEPGAVPSGSLADAMEALAELGRREAADGDVRHRFRLRPDPRLIAAIVACRDYAGSAPGDVEPIVVLADPDHADQVKILCVLSMDRAAWMIKEGE